MENEPNNSAVFLCFFTSVSNTPSLWK